MKKLTGYVTLSEASRRMGVSEKTVRRQLDDGRLGGLETPLGRLVRETSLEKRTAEKK